MRKNTLSVSVKTELEQKNGQSETKGIKARVSLSLWALLRTVTSGQPGYVSQLEILPVWKVTRDTDSCVTSNSGSSGLLLVVRLSFVCIVTQMGRMRQSPSQLWGYLIYNVIMHWKAFRVTLNITIVNILVFAVISRLSRWPRNHFFRIKMGTCGSCHVNRLYRENEPLDRKLSLSSGECSFPALNVPTVASIITTLKRLVYYDRSNERIFDFISHLWLKCIHRSESGLWWPSLSWMLHLDFSLFMTCLTSNFCCSLAVPVFEFQRF